MNNKNETTEAEKLLTICNKYIELSDQDKINTLEMVGLLDVMFSLSCSLQIDVRKKVQEKQL